MICLLSDLDGLMEAMVAVDVRKWTFFFDIARLPGGRQTGKEEATLIADLIKGVSMQKVTAGHFMT